MTNEGSYVALGLKVWKAQLDRADKLFGGLSSEVVLREIAPGRNRLLYLWGHLTAMHDAMLPLLGLGDRFHPEFDVAFVSNPDKSQAAIPSHEQVRQVWKTVNGELWKGFEKMSWSDWLQRHTAVSEEDFAKDASRHFTRSEVQKPPATGKEKCKAIGASGNVINGGAVHRMDYPEKRDQECSG